MLAKGTFCRPTNDISCTWTDRRGLYIVTPLPPLYTYIWKHWHHSSCDKYHAFPLVFLHVVNKSSTGEWEGLGTWYLSFGHSQQHVCYMWQLHEYGYQSLAKNLAHNKIPNALQYSCQVAMKIKRPFRILLGDAVCTVYITVWGYRAYKPSDIQSCSAYSCSWIM